MYLLSVASKGNILYPYETLQAFIVCAILKLMSDLSLHFLNLIILTLYDTS